MVCLLDRDGTVFRCNRSMTEWLGRGTDELAGKKCYELMHSGRTFFERCPYLEMLRTGRRESFELPLGDRWYQVTAEPLHRDGEIVGAVHIVRDITDRRLTDEALAARSRWLIAINALAVDLAALPGDTDLGPFLAARLRELTDGAAVAFSEYDPDDKVLVTTSIEFKTGAVKTLTSPLARRLRKTRSPVSDEVYAEILAARHATRGVADRGELRRHPARRGCDRAPAARRRQVRRRPLRRRRSALRHLGDRAAERRARTPAEELEVFANLAAVSLRRRRAEVELRRASAYNRSLIEASLDPLVTIGPDGLITDVNRATVGATGRTREELVGTDFADYFTEPETRQGGIRAGLPRGRGPRLPAGDPAS